MGRRVNHNPSYLHHHSSGKARVVVYGHLGQRKQLLLPGEFDSRESLAEFHRVCALLRANGGRLPAPRLSGLNVSIAELVLRYMEEHASVYYVDPVTKEPTSEMQCLSDAFRALNRLFGSLPVAEFDSLKVESLQKALATGAWMTDAERAK